MLNVPKKIIVHHSADSSKDDQLARINQYHRNRQFPLSSLGYYVGYHYLIQRTGQIVKTREDWEEGAQTKGENFNSLGVCLEGNFNLEWPNQAQIDSLGALLVEKVNEYKLTALLIEPHRKYADTDCYGRLLDDHWASRVYLKYQLNIFKKILDMILIQLQAIREK